MKTTIDDLVVINKAELDSWIKYIDSFPLYPEDRKNLMSLNCKPLKPFIEKAFRDGFRFKNDTKIIMAKQSDYDHSGYDEGHLANAEDFASDCPKDEKTFRFYNCLPQTPNLNRGIWKKWETGIRVESQSDSLLVICGGIFTTGKIIGDKVAVPDYCFKIVQSLKTKKVIWILFFTNKEKDSTMEFKTLEELEKFSQYQLKDLLSK